MFSITRSKRFDDVDADAGYAYRGWDYDLAGAGITYRARVYDDEPGRVTVVSPTNARTLPDIQEFVAYLSSSLNRSTVLLYDSTTGTYREIDSVTLEFL